MLLSLSIRDIVLIEQLDLSWSGGLSTLTGETGAGKSILLDALGLAIGARGDASLVRRGCKQGSATAIFNCQARPDILAVLEENGLPHEDAELVLRRVQGADGKSKAFINDTAVSVGLLASIGAALVEIHGQNETLTLTEPHVQLELLDNFADAMPLKADVGKNYGAWREAEKALAGYRSQIEQNGAEREALRRLADDLDRLQPKDGEAEALEQQRSLLQNAGKVTQDLDAVVSLLGGEQGAEISLNNALRRLERVAGLVEGSLSDAIAAVERAQVETTEALAQIEDIVSKLDLDPEALQTLEDRLFGMRDIARRQKCDVGDLPKVHEEVRVRLEAIDDDPAVLRRYEASVRASQEQYQATAHKLHEVRIVAAERLDAAINAELAPLKLESAQFRTEVGEAAQAGPTGIDRVAFLARTNAETPEGPLAKIASGGELARFMLALKLVLAGSERPRCLIFDEVDAGVGGAVAEAVGQRLAKLARHHQVLVVTHAPQVAARGNAHWLVEKSDAGGARQTTVKPLSMAERREEIARMLSGARVTDEARAAADRLLEHLS